MIRIRGWGLVLAAGVLLVGCKPSTEQAQAEKPVNRKVTKENFERVKQDMPFDEVHALLGPSETLRVDQHVVTNNGQVSGHAIEVRRWLDGDSWIVVTFNFGKVTGKEGQNLREEAQELRAALVGKWSQSTAAELSKSADTYTFLASGEAQMQTSQREQGGPVRISGGGTWKMEGKTLLLKLTVVDPPSASLKEARFEILHVDREKLVFKKDGKEVTLFRVS